MRPPAHQANPEQEAQAAPKRRVRLRPAERERQIVEEAVRFFAEVGFGGQTRELANRLGITQGLLYRYFPSKEVLMDAVYKEVFESRWNPAWTDDLRDRRRPLRERLIELYVDYARVIHTFEWVRIFIHAGLAGLDTNSRYFTLLRKHLYPVVIAELRHELQLPRSESDELSESEVQLMLNLHGMVFFIGLRRHVYSKFSMPPDSTQLIADQVDLFLGGARSILQPRG